MICAAFGPGISYLKELSEASCSKPRGETAVILARELTTTTDLFIDSKVTDVPSPFRRVTASSPTFFR